MKKIVTLSLIFLPLFLFGQEKAELIGSLGNKGTQTESSLVMTSWEEYNYCTKGYFYA